MDDETERFVPDDISPENISLNREFLLFDPKRFQSTRGKIKSSIVLDTEELPPFLVKIFSTYATHLWRNDAIVPSGLASGYIVTQDDYDRDLRIKKGSEIRNNNKLTVSKFSRDLNISIDNVYLEKLGLAKMITQYSNYEISPEARNVFERLRLLLFFPNGSSYESKAVGDGYEEYIFYYYYPVDSGPLAKIEIDKEENEGVHIFLPNDPSLLSQIKGKFVMGRSKQDNT